MPHAWTALLGVAAALTSASISADLPQNIPTPADQAVVRVPKCLQYPDSKTYVPCTGVVPVDKVSGNALSWQDLIQGSSTTPFKATPIINNKPVDDTNPLPVSCTGCGGGTGNGTIGRRVFWEETTTPLAANASFTSTSHDNGGTIQGVPTKWNSFSCFMVSDQPATLYLQGSNDNTSWYNVQTKVTGSAMTSVYLSQPMFTRYWRCMATNASMAQTYLVINSSFGM